MGLYSRICPYCNTNIRYDGTNGEKCRLIHVRHGEKIGEAVGHYTGLGSVKEDAVFNGINSTVNSHDEIIESCHYLDDSGKSSGLMACHEVCYEEHFDGKLIISEGDPEQGFGTLRKSLT